MNKTIKIGQIGIGHNHGEGKMQAVRKLPDLFEVVGICEENPEWVKSRGSLKCYEGLKFMPENELLEKCDAILIETDVWNLTQTAQRCVDAGKHIHLDKPANGSYEDYKSVIDTAKEKKLVLQLGYMYRYNPAVKMCIDAVKSGKLGEINSINAEMSTFHYKEYKQWLKNFNGGIMYILGSHLVDLIVYLLGEPQNVTSFLKHTLLDGIDFPDNNQAILEYNKALARINVSSVEVNGWGRRQLVVCGNKGTIEIKPMENTTKMTYSDLATATDCYDDMKKDIDITDIPKECRYDEMMSDFYGYITGSKENPFTYDHELTVHKVLSEVCGGYNVTRKADIMKAMLIDENRNLVWSEVQKPIPKDDEILIEIHAAALNRADLLQRKGTYPSPAGWPEWMGLEVSGTVAAMGSTAEKNSDFQIGDKVCALLGGGGYAEYACAPYGMVMPLPKGLTFEEGSSLPEAYATSYLNLFYEGKLKAGQTAFIPAGASGLASVAIPMAKAFGARVITSVLSDEIAQKIMYLGADIVINSSRDDVAEVLKSEEQNGHPVNMAMDCLCGDTLGKSLPYMAQGGYWVVISTLAGTETNVLLRPLLTKGLHLVGSMLRKRSSEEKAALLSELVKNVWPKLESGEIKPTVHKVLPIENALQAHEILERGENVGKVVLRVR